MKLKQNNNYSSEIKQPSLELLRKKSQLNSVILTGSGSPDYLAIDIYWDAFRSWYNPKSLYKKDGNIYHIKKLKTPGIYLNYTNLAKEFGCSKETIRRKVVKLEKLGLLQRSFQHRSTVTTDSYNQLIIYVLQTTSYFFNEFGIDRDDIPHLTPQTNHHYIKEKYGITFGAQAQSNEGGDLRGGIHKLEDTKELNNIVISKDIRSNAQERESNFCKNFIFEDNIPNHKCHSFNQEKRATIHILKSTRVPNKRKKRTKAEIQDKKAKFFTFRQYEEKKDLKAHYPLGSEDSLKLQILSGRDFTLNAMNEILLDMSKRVGCLFSSKAQFLSYMSKVFKNEKRDSVKTANTNFRIKANQTEEFREYLKKEKFLSEIEQQAITQVCKENQLKAKLAGILSLETAYNLLSKIKSFNLIDHSHMQIYVRSPITVTENERSIILSQIRAVYSDIRSLNGGIEDLEFIVEENYGKLRYQTENTKSQAKPEGEIIDLPSGIWGNISKKLIEKYGINTYKNWFSKINSSIDEINKVIELRFSSSLAYDRITMEYGNFISGVAREMNFKIQYLENRRIYL